jgi:glutamine synthetase
MSSEIFLEYVWLDGHRTPNLRSKVKVINWKTPSQSVKISDIPQWNFDGSSTNQAPGNDSERILNPVRLYQWRKGHYFILCEVINTDNGPHETNFRSELRNHTAQADKEQFWWGFEQEFFITQNYKILGFPAHGYPQPQGYYYCGVGGNQVVGRELSETHLRACLRMGIELTGTNAEVAIGQWEYQCFNKDTLKACDDLWMSRYVLYRLSEEYGWDISLNPKPVHGDWNGSGCHTNFSTTWMREGARGYDGVVQLMKSLEKNHQAHIDNYGENNEQRLTGLHETQHIDEFSWGIGDRGASIRVPISMSENQWKGYIEDRRPASNCDPYRVAASIIKSTTAA